jgi:carboxylesterase type B
VSTPAVRDLHHRTDILDVPQLSAGFLNLNIPSCAGNSGCKDIILALKWIKNNVSAFQGDPDNVTLYGESAGASIINLLSLSPMAKGTVCAYLW